MEYDRNNLVPLYQSKLQRWVRFADQYMTVSEQLGARIHSISDITETKTLELSHQFQLMTTSAMKQSQQLKEIIYLSHTVNVNGKLVEIQEISTLLQETFMNSISSILKISKQAMVMIYIIDDALKTLTHIEKSIHEIEMINHKTKYLSLNATIEAVRAGEAGESFQVVASEVRELSNDTQRLATNIRTQVNQMNETLVSAQDILQSVARIDMSDNILSKDRLDEMMAGLVQNSITLSGISQQVAESVATFSESAKSLVTNIQFQDRIKQDFQHIMASLDYLKSTMGSLKQESIRDCDLVDDVYEKIDELNVLDHPAAHSSLLDPLLDSGGGSSHDDITLF